MLDLNKDLLKLNEISFKRLEEEGLGVSNGRIAKLLVTILNENVAEFYKTLSEQHVQAFLSKATGNSLNLIGELLNCYPSPGEDEETYRYRISKQTLSLAKANETAIRLACLSVEGVEDVVLKPYTHGTGSFSVYVVTDEPITPDSVLEAVTEAVEEFKAFGIRAFVFRPNVLRVELRARILFSKNVPDLDQQMIRKQAEQTIKDYVNSRNIGEAIDPQYLREEIFKMNKDILGVEFYQFRINNRPVLLFEQEAGWNERFVESTIPDAILVS